MRAILGEPDKPGSSYILVLRGLSPESEKYFYYHRTAYPTWGCLLFPDITDTYSVSAYDSGIHRLFTDLTYRYETDKGLLDLVMRMYPPYEEDDPMVPESGELTPKVTRTPRFHRLEQHVKVSYLELKNYGDEVIEMAYDNALSGIFSKIRADASKYVEFSKVEQPDGSLRIIATLSVAELDPKSLGLPEPPFLIPRIISLDDLE